MLARVFSACLAGVEAALVRVEVDVSQGLPTFATVGLPDPAVRESRERVRTAIRNSGFAFPLERVTVNLAPADVRKEGVSFDLPIALGLLAATGAVNPERLAGLLVALRHFGRDGGGEHDPDDRLEPGPDRVAARRQHEVPLLYFRHSSSYPFTQTICFSV